MENVKEELTVDFDKKIDSIKMQLLKEMNCKAIYPDIKFCGDNAAMIAWAGIKRFKKNLIDNIEISARSRWWSEIGRSIKVLNGRSFISPASGRRRT